MTTQNNHPLETLLVEKIFKEKSTSDDFFTSQISFTIQSLKTIIVKYFERHMENVSVSHLEFNVNFDSFEGVTVFLEPKRDIQIIRPEETNPENQALATQVKFLAKFDITSKGMYDMVTLHILETMPEVSVLRLEPKMDGRISKAFYFFKKLSLDSIIVEIATHR